MKSGLPYSRKELQRFGASDFPDRGIYCPKCKGYIPEFEDLSDQKIREIWELPAHKREEELMAQTGCNKRWAKIWILHRNGPNKK